MSQHTITNTIGTIGNLNNSFEILLEKRKPKEKS